MRTKQGLELRQLGPKTFILEATSEYKGANSKIITFNSTAAFCGSLLRIRTFLLMTCAICYKINSLYH